MVAGNINCKATGKNIRLGIRNSEMLTWTPRAIPSRDSDFARNFHLMEGPSSSSRNPYIDPDYHTESRMSQLISPYTYIYVP